MNKKLRKAISYVVMLIASYLIAINFMFQLWSSLLLMGLVFVLFVALYNDLSTRNLDIKFMFLSALSLFILLFPQIGTGSNEFGDYSYPPYTIILDSKIEMPLYFYPKYFHTEHFTGIATYNNTQIIQYDLNRNELKTYGFNSHPMTEIGSYAYFGNDLYVSGEYIDQTAGQGNRYSIMRVNLTTDEVESFMTGDNSYQVYNLYDLLLISRFDHDIGRRVYELYDDAMTVVGTLDNISSMAYLDNVYNDGDYSVLVINRHRYDLYFQGSFVKTLAIYDDSQSPKLVIFHDDRIYINSGIMIDGKYVIDAFDMMGNIDEGIRYSVPQEDDFVLFGEKYLIVNDGFNFHDLILWNASSVYDYSGNPIFVSERLLGLKIYEINHTLYGLLLGFDGQEGLIGLYRLEECHYTVLFRFEQPQKNVVYYLSFLAVYLLIFGTDEPLWKKKDLKTTRESSEN